MVLGNTFHLFLTPGHDLIARLGGLHRFMRWDRPVITDSGGFQVFSMGHGTVADEIKGRAAQSSTAGERSGAILRIEEQGVTFRSYLDGSTHFMGPETSMEIQAALDSDIALVFDECTPFHGGRDYTARSTERTHRWLDRCLAWHDEHGPEGQVVYGIVQGGVEEDLRRASAQEVAARPVGGIAIGGTLGEHKDQMFEVVEWAIDELDEERPRHLLGIGEVDDLVRGVQLGIDTFDCAMPTRIGRHGMAVVPDPAKRWRVDLAKARWRDRRRAAARRLPVPRVRPRLHAGLPALPDQGARADRPAAADDPQPRLPAAADGRPARRGRRVAGWPTRPRPCTAARRRGSCERRGLQGLRGGRLERPRRDVRDADGARDRRRGRAAARRGGSRARHARPRRRLRARRPRRRRGRPRRHVTGVDLAEGMLAAARERHPDIEFVHGDVEALPFADGRFDAVIAAFVVNHLPEPEVAAAELARVSRGRVALAMWGPPDEVALLGLPADAVTAAGLDRSAIPAGPSSLRFTDAGELTGLLGGLLDVELREVRFDLPVASLDELWAGVLGGTVRTAARLAAATPDQRDRARAELGRLAEPHRRGAGYALPTMIRIATGCCPR